MSYAASDDLIDLTDGADRLQNALTGAATKDEALEIALSAADLAMRALTLAKDAVTKKSLNVKVRSLLDEAERIKYNENWRAKSPASSKRNVAAQYVQPSNVRRLKEPLSTRNQSKSEQILVLKASTLNGFKFPPWQDAPKDSEFELRKGEQFFLDMPRLHLSQAQLKQFDGWQRPQTALPPSGWRSADDETSGPTMSPSHKIDLVQDAATDCSVVASLCAVTSRAEKGHAKILPAVVYPYDTKNGLPLISPNGKYVLRLNFNGTFRKVQIDDSLPVSKTSRVMHVMDRKNPNLLWPALVEKAYLKVRGGYDFPGSNSGTDLWVLTGWIPEQIFLQNEDTSPNDVWRRVYGAHKYGDVLVTMGTGKMSNRAEREIGLAGEHDYAVLDLREVDGQKLMLVKNPWCEGTSWRGVIPSAEPNVGDTATGESIPKGHDLPTSRDLLNSEDELSPGTFWIDLNTVTQHFESIYLNWNSGLFKQRQDLHFEWNLKTSSQTTSFVNHPQLTFSVSNTEPVWLLLCRHFQDRDVSVSDENNDYEAAGFISLYVFDKDGSRVFLGEEAYQRGVFVDSPQTLLRLENLQPDRVYTVVPAEHDLPRTAHTFTLSAFSNGRVTLGEATDKYSHQAVVSSSWTDETAGGNANSPTYSQNPQFKITIHRPTPIAILLETSSQHLNVHVKLVHGRGLRVQTVRLRDIVFDSKEYRRQCALATHANLDAGTYTIICSTFEPNQLGSFTLRVESNTLAQLVQLPREGAGKIKITLSHGVFRAGQHKIAAPIVPQRLGKVTAFAKNVLASQTPQSQQGGTARPRSLVRITFELGTGPQRRILIASADGEYSDSVSGIRTEEIDLSPQMVARVGLWLVVERMFTPTGLDDEMFACYLWTDTPEGVAVGVWRKWDD